MPLTVADAVTSRGCRYPDVESFDPFEAAGKVLAAIKRGSLPSALRINSVSRRGLSLRLELQSHQGATTAPRMGIVFPEDVETANKTLAWLDRHYPGGLLYREAGSRVKRSRHGFGPDSGAYGFGANNPPGTPYSSLHVSIPLMHEHQNYRANSLDLDKQGRPRWFCMGCNHPLGVKDARAKGLLP